MPAFDYTCTNKKCQHQFEQIAKYEQPVNCPKCGKPAKRELTTNRVSFQFNWFEE